MNKVAQGYFLLAPQEVLLLGVVCQFVVATVYFTVSSTVLPPKLLKIASKDNTYLKSEYSLASSIPRAHKLVTFPSFPKTKLLLFQFLHACEMAVVLYCVLEGQSRIMVYCGFIYYHIFCLGAYRVLAD